jgi:hypothetical protein
MFWKSWAFKRKNSAEKYFRSLLHRENRLQSISIQGWKIVALDNNNKNFVEKVAKSFGQTRKQK